MNKISVIVSYSGHGGVEVVTTNLLNALARSGTQVELVLIKNNSHLLNTLDKRISVVKLTRSSAWLALPELISYLKRTNSDMVLSVKDRATQVVAIAAVLAKFDRPVVGHIHSNMLTGFKNGPSLMRKIRYATMTVTYKKLSKVYGVSNDAVNALITITGLPENHFKVLPNVIITSRLFELSAKPPQHTWLKDKSKRVIVGSGRLSAQKNFSLLIEAFSLIKPDLPNAYLVILGDGGLRSELTRQIETLNLSEYIDLAGFYENPYPEIKSADLFVLSSNSEGSPTVLTESLALHTPVVATACGDTAKTLWRGKLGNPVPKGNAAELAQAIKDSLNTSYSEEQMQAAISIFTEEVATSVYLQEYKKVINDFH